MAGGGIRDKKSLQLAGCVTLILFITAAMTGMAQLPTATILGIVKDSTGAVAPGTTLTARNTDTGQTRSTVSAGDGSYRFSALPVGNYEVRAEHAGFRAEVRGGLTLTVSQEAVVNFTLEVGAIEQAVSVTAEPPLVNTTTGSLGGLVDEQKIADLPLNGRNYADLVLLQPGVSQHRTGTVGGLSLAGDIYSSNGATIYSNTYLLDGASLESIFGTSSASLTGSTLGVEGIREYSVLTNSFSAEYGMRMGSQMMLVSKNGTNSFHGSLFEYLRNSALDARNFFDYKTPASNRRLPAFSRNNFGASFGGPIKKDKTFFFGVYEGIRQRLGVTMISNVIPASAKVDGGAGGVPQIAPVIKPLLTLFPDPNLPNNRLTFPFTQPTDENYGQMRIDQTLANQDSLFGRYTVHDSQLTQPLAFPQFKNIDGGRGQFSTLSENHIFSPTLLNTFRFSYSRTRVEQESPSGIIGPQFSFVPGQEVGNIVIGGVTTLGASAGAPTLTKQNIFTWSDDLFYTRGRHSLKFGTLINHYQQYILSGSLPGGRIQFPNVTAFLLGQPSTYLAETPGSIIDRTYHFNTLGFYAQDDLRVTPSFTLNLGLRYEFNTQYHETKGHGANIHDLQHDATATVGLPFLNPSLKNFGPRFGFAWDPTGDAKTSIRGGFVELFDVADWGNGLQTSASAQPPFSSQGSVINPSGTLVIPLVFPPSAGPGITREMDYHMKQPHMLQYNLTMERQLPFDMALTVGYAGSRGMNIGQYKEGNPTVPIMLPDGRQFWPVNPPRTNPNWATIVLVADAGNSWYDALQVNLQKRLTKGLQFQSAYTWSKTIDETQAQSGANDLASSPFGTDPTHRTVDRGLAEFDVAQNWRLNAIYHLPELSASGGLAGKILGGWWMSGILSLQGGFPFSASLASNRSRSGVNNANAGIDRPDLVSGRSFSSITQGTSAGCLGVPAGTPLGTPNRWFDPCAFTIPAAGFLGTAGRDILRGPGLANLDFSLVKDTTIRSLGESGKLEFRAEVFNILNHANFAAPSTSVFAAAANVEPALVTAGQITSTLNPSRQIQFALKLIF